MGAILLEIINNRVIQAAALAWAIAQAIDECEDGIPPEPNTRV